MIWITAFPIAGGLAGYMIAGRRAPLAVAAMGAAAGLIAARDGKVALAAAKAFGLGGLVGGFFFCSVIAFHIRGYSEFALFIASLATPAFYGALRFQSVVQ